MTPVLGYRKSPDNLTPQPENPAVRNIPLSQNQIAVVDVDDYERLNCFRWYAARVRKTNDFYAVRRDGAVRQRMHRVILGVSIDDARFVDHINGDTLDNRKSNLRACTLIENSRNTRVRKDNKTGFKGVMFYARTGKWTAQIRVNKKRMHLGYFDTIEDAGAAYIAAAEMHHREFSRKAEAV